MSLRVYPLLIHYCGFALVCLFVGLIAFDKIQLLLSGSVQLYIETNTNSLLNKKSPKIFTPFDSTSLTESFPLQLYNYLTFYFQELLVFRLYYDSIQPVIQLNTLLYPAQHQLSFLIVQLNLFFTSSFYNGLLRGLINLSFTESHIALCLSHTERNSHAYHKAFSERCNRNSKSRDGSQSNLFLQIFSYIDL